MKNIGLNVCYEAKNFGSLLQIYATIYKVKEFGYNPTIIKYKKIITPIFILQTIPRFFNPNFISVKFGYNKKKEFLKSHPEIAEKVKIRSNRAIEFSKKHFDVISKNYVGWENLVKYANKDYDIFLCGSDQLWLPSNLGSHFHTLEYVKKNKPKISYATSFGVEYIPWFQKITTRRYLNRIQFLSTREQKGKDIIKSLTGRDAEVVCDPTLLLSKDEWDSVIPNKNLIKDKYILCYFLGNNIEHRNEAKKLAKKLNLKIASVVFLDNCNEFDINFGDIQIFDIDAFDFVNLIRNAQYVLTDSFHGSVFSIINEKKFITFNRFLNSDKNSRNSRIDNLFSILSLENRRYNGDIEKIIEEIDYKKVNKKLNDFREKSANFLKNSLNNSME